MASQSALEKTLDGGFGGYIYLLQEVMASGLTASSHQWPTATVFSQQKINTKKPGSLDLNSSHPRKLLHLCYSYSMDTSGKPLLLEIRQAVQEAVGFPVEVTQNPDNTFLVRLLLD